jgi:N-acetylneuraminic acid mutarotase
VRSGVATPRWRPLVFALAAVLALLPLLAHQARGADNAARLDWGTRPRIPTDRDFLAVAAAPDGLLYAAGGQGGVYLKTVEAYDPATNRWSTRAPMLTARSAFGLAAAANGKLYAVGGTNGTDTLSSVEEYDPAADRWVFKAALDRPRYDLALAAASNGKLYAVGGATDSGTVLNTVQEYDPVTNTWTNKRPMRLARSFLGLAAAPNGKLYAVGGTDGNNAFYNVVEEYDPATDTWQDRAPLGVGRAGLALATAATGRLYAAGGIGSGNADVATVEELDPQTTGGWSLKSPLPSARAMLSMVPAPNGRLYAIGGHDASLQVGLVDEYDPQTDSWFGAKTASLPGVRGYAASAVAGGKLYVFGGLSGGSPPSVLADVVQYDPRRDVWTGMTSMPTPRYGAAAVTANNGKIYVVGGSSGSTHCPTFVCTTVEEFTPPVGSGGGTWRGASDGIRQLPGPRTFLGMALGSDGKLYATGGSDGMTARSETYQYDPAASPSFWFAMALMPHARTRFGLARGGDGKLYAVGGEQGGSLVNTVERYVLATPGGTDDGWEGPDGIAQLPAPRTALGLVGLPSGQLIAAGGTDSASGSTPLTDVFEYDPVANGWSARAPLPTASYGLGLAQHEFRQLFATGGFGQAGALSVAVAGVRDGLPSVQAGGPYLAATDRIQLTASGSDPEGDSLSYAWDLDGSLRYATPGQSVTFSTAGLAPGPHIVRVRALDPFGGYALASTTVAVPTVCGPRPNVAVATSRGGPGQLQAVIGAQTFPATPGNSLQRITITRIDNATVTVNDGPVTTGATVPFPAGASQATLLVQRQNPGASSMIAFAVTDSCGEWRSFVGGGPSAF